MRSILFTAAGCLALAACDQQAAQQEKQPVPPIQNASVCADDITKLCPGVEGGGGRIGACLAAHKDQVSEACRKFNNL